MTIHSNGHHPSPNGRVRVVITGRGVISPIGNDVHSFWDNLIHKRSGVERVTLFDPSPFPTQIAAEVKAWDPTPWIDFKEARRMARCSQFGIAAATQALDDAGLLDHDLDEEVAIFLGTGIGGWERGYDGMMALHLNDRGWKAISPFDLPAALPNIPAFHIAHAFGIHGHLSTHTSACATGTGAIVEAAELIRRGWAHTVISGATEAAITDVAFGGYSKMRGMSTRNGDPHAAIRPFDRGRDGFLMGEGAAIFILEELSHAQARGATIYGEVMSGASTSDAYHIAQPNPDGLGAQRAMQLAAKHSGIALDQIGYINPHGPGTPLGDEIEVAAMKAVFGEHIYNIPISSTKSMVGHAMGSAGALEALATLRTLETQTVHPTLNCDDPDEGFDLDFVPETRPADVRYAMSNNFGLGGQNASLILRRWEMEVAA
ncbi:MAG: beta-ketoacyl-[acyl-carrier-protein] synthase II [Anaerolineales bacterium]|nr:beta-ketoacyl-[acyl-carrier-protein] synthase II [Anaerolineales bacterium]MCB9127761.1 beta-ketoacyl-[acyl-carrier-protein] synthase II [Ardenticatenales bacterium]